MLGGKSSFIIEEFSFYKVFLYGRNVFGEPTDYGIHIKVPSGLAVMKFTRDYTLKNACVKQPNGTYEFQIFLRVEKYPAFIDILRNEKPLFFYYNFDSDQCYITTSDEPVGEGENELDAYN